MKVNVDIMRESARTLNSTIEGQLKESKKILKEIIQNDLPQLNDKKKEEYKTELQSVKKQVNVIKENIKDISNWIMNKADQFESQEPKIMQIAENIEANVIAHSMNVKDATKIIKELNKNGKYFDKKYLKDVKAYICESDEEFERLYNAIGKKGDVSQVDSFVYDGKIYLRKSANEHTIINAINSYIATTVRKDKKASNKNSKSKENKNKNPITSPKGINKALTEYATRMADKTLNNKEKRNKKIKNEKEYNYNVNFLKFIEKNLAEVGYKDIVIEASYGTKTDLKKALKKITGDNTFYVTMVNAMYVITEKPNATEQEISTAKDQLAGLKETLKSKCKEYQKPSEKPKTSNKGGNGSKKSSGNGGGSNRSVPSSNNGDGSNGSGQETEQYNSPADLNRGYYSTLNAKNGAQKYNSPADLNREYYNGKKSSNGLGSKGSASSSNSGGGSKGSASSSNSGGGSNGNGQSKIKTTGTTKKPGSSLGLEFPEGTTKKPGSSLGLKFPNSNE